MSHRAVSNIDDGRFLVSAPGKVILFGEHAVVYGKAAVAASVDLRTYLHIERRADDQLRVRIPDLGFRDVVSWSAELLPYSLVREDAKDVFNEELYQNLKSNLVLGHDETMHEAVRKHRLAGALTFLYLYTSLSATAKKRVGISLTVKSGLPVGAGLGSSASYSVCLATGLLLVFGAIHLPSPNDSASMHKACAELINRWAFQGEKVIHGTPSGIDNAVATHGGAIIFKKGHMDSAKGFHKLRFLLTNTKVPRDTKTQVSNVRVKYDQHPLVINPILDGIDGVTEILKEILSLDDDTDIISKLEDLIDLNHHLVNALGVGHPAIDKIREITIRHGLHSKLTGAGGGGCVLTLLRDDVHQEKIKQVKSELVAAGFECFEVSVGGHGVGVMDATGVVDDGEILIEADNERLRAIDQCWRFFS